jgi:type II secretory pathway pseudopilin PulG
VHGQITTAWSGGFTLVELVVIGIIAILIAILLNGTY